MAMEILRGGWFPEAWDIPIALGLGVVITGYMGDYVAGWISQYIPSEWLNPTSEFIIGIILFILGGFVAGDISMYLRLFSFGALAVAIADTVTVLLGMGTPAASSFGGVRVITSTSPTLIKTHSSNPGTTNTQDFYSMLEKEKKRGEILAYQKVMNAAAEKATQARLSAERARELAEAARRAEEEAQRWAREAEKQQAQKVGTYQ
jgi:hypothetical protein